MQKNSIIHFTCRFPWVKCFATSKAKLRHFGLAATLYQNTPAPQTNTSYHQESSIMKHQPVSASLTTQSYQGQGLAEQYVSARTQLNPYFEPQSQETYSFPISFWRGGWGEECSGLASRYHHVLCCTARHLHVDDPSSQIRVAAPLYP